MTGYLSDLIIDEMVLLNLIIGTNCLIAIVCYMAIGAVIIFRHYTSLSIYLYQSIVCTCCIFLCLYCLYIDLYTDPEFSKVYRIYMEKVGTKKQAVDVHQICKSRKY